MQPMKSMPANSHISQEWRNKVQTYLTSQGLPASGQPRNPEASREIFFRLHGGDNCCDGDVDYLDFYDAVARIYDESCFNPQLQVNSMALCAAMIEMFEPRTVLEAGCTSGIATVFFAEQFPHTSFIGSDYSREMIAVTDERIAKKGIGNARTICTEHKKLPDHIENESIDLIIAEGSAPAPYETEMFMAFVGSVLVPIMAPDGIFICLSPPVRFDAACLAKELKKFAFQLERDIELVRHEEERLPPAVLLVLQKKVNV